MKTTVLIFSLLWMLTYAANADIVSVNFNRWGDGVCDVSDGYGVEPANNWFRLQEYSTPQRQGTDLTTSKGKTSTIDFAITGGNWERFEWGTASLYTPMASGLAFYANTTLTISDINSTFPEYDVIVYVTGWNAENNEGGYSDGTITYYCEVPNPRTASLIRSTDTDITDGADEGTYVRFNDLTANSVAIRMSVPSGSNGAGIGGFQIVGADRGAAYLLSPKGIANKDFDSNELTWISGDDPDDPNLTVNSFDLYYYSKPVANVTDDDPNFANPANAVTTVLGATSPSSLTFSYETAYFWYVNSNAVWNSIDITGNLTETISSRVAAFEVEPSEVPPKVYILSDGARTWLGKTMSVSTVVHEKGSFTYDWQVTGPAGYTGNPNDFLTNTTLVDMGDGVWEGTAAFNAAGTDPNIIGWYTIKLTATDTIPTSGSDTMWIQVTETACEVFTENGGWLNEFDADDDCEITMEDFRAWAEAWLDDKNPGNPYVYTP